MQDFDKLWNYNDPAATETKFKEKLKDSPAGTDLSLHLQLLTQIARTQGLQRKFEEAHNTLNEVETLLPHESETAHIRFFLERGRVFNSSGEKRNAEVCFHNALDIARKLGDDFYAVDALHMLAIVASPDNAIRLNEEALILVEGSKQEQAQKWLGALYNNLGWSYFDKLEFERALSIFLRALKWREEKKSAPEIFLAKWCVARTLRALNRVEEAIKIQLALFEESMSTGAHDGYVHEELGELYLIQQDQRKAGFHFSKAYELLISDPYLSQNEKTRLERIRNLSDK